MSVSETLYLCLVLKLLTNITKACKKIVAMPLLYLTNYATLLFNINSNKHLGLSAQIATYKIILKLEKPQNITLLKAVVK